LGAEIMLAEEIDFHEMFNLHPTAMALLSKDLVILDANEEFLRATGRPLEEVEGRSFFDIAPKMPAVEGGDPKWTAIEAAMSSARREVHRLSRYDLEDPFSPGTFTERYWSVVVQPVRCGQGTEEVLELSAREITPVIDDFRALEAEQGQA
jgi:PAS domain S-box-containing protein